MHGAAETGRQRMAGPVVQWRELLWQACQVLAIMPDLGVVGYSITRALSDGPEEGRAAVELASRLAQEHGLQMEAQVSGCCLTIYLRRGGRPAD